MLLYLDFVTFCRATHIYTCIIHVCIKNKILIYNNINNYINFMYLLPQFKRGIGLYIMLNCLLECSSIVFFFLFHNGTITTCTSRGSWCSQLSIAFIISSKESTGKKISKIFKMYMGITSTHIKGYNNSIYLFCFLISCIF